MKNEKADRYFTCIVCPNGCEVEVKQNGDSISVSGNKCKRGEVYVVQELTDPRRTISTTVPISNGELPLCSVRLTKPIPKKEIFRVMQEIRRIFIAQRARAPPMDAPAATSAATFSFVAHSQ